MKQRNMIWILISQLKMRPIIFSMLVLYVDTHVHLQSYCMMQRHCAQLGPARCVIKLYSGSREVSYNSIVILNVLLHYTRLAY